MSHRIIRFAIAILCLLACFYAIRAAGRAGLSSFYSRYAVKASMMPGSDPDSLLPAAEEASRLTPSDPEAYRARGVARVALDQPADAAVEFTQAASLRPRHYLLWLELGRARDQADDVDGALQALQESVRLAPYFAQPRWQLGNVLLRAGRYEEAFAELRRAIAGDSTRLPLALELAWAASGGDAHAVEQFIQPANPSARLQLARFLAKHGKATEAVDLFREGGGIAEADQRALVAELVTAKKFTAAYEVWASGRTGLDESNHGLAAITDGSFENKISPHDPGFGWQINQKVQTVRIRLETKQAHDGVNSLQVEWNGNSDPYSQLVTQFALVEPKTRYRLHFVALVKDVISGGMPVVVVSDASSAEYRVLGQSTPLKKNDREWEEYDFEFETGEQTEAALLSLQRQPCASDPCPIFGRLWLDAFSLKKS